MESTHPRVLWWNGEQVKWEEATVHLTEIAWSTVGAVFEGIRAYWNDDQGEIYVFRLRDHLERLMRSMKLVRLPIHYSVEELQAAILGLLRDNEVREDTYIFPLAFTAETTKRRYDRPGFESSVYITTKPMPSHLLTGMTHNVRVSSWRRISEEVMPPRAKNVSNYRNGQLARMEVQADGYDNALLLNLQGKVAEAPGACVVLMRNGVMITPDLTSGILESITRDAILTMAREKLGLKVEERVVDRTELYVADEVFLCGTAAEITPVAEVDKYPVGSGEIGPVTHELEVLFNDVLRGRTDAYAGWRTPVGVAAAVGV
ncbi:MAG: branched-chain amino acid transaminase [Thermomicrobiales bacterium]